MNPYLLLLAILTGFVGPAQFDRSKSQLLAVSSLKKHQRVPEGNRGLHDQQSLTSFGQTFTSSAYPAIPSADGPTITVSGFTSFAIQAAIDAAPSSGATIAIPAGRYVFTSECSMANKNNLTFSASGSVEFYVPPGGSISHMLNAVGPVTNIRLTGITFNNQSSAAGQGMVFSNEKAPIDGYEIDHCTFTGPNINCNAIKLNPQTYVYGVNVSVLVKNVYIHDNNFFSLGRMGIELQNHGWEKGESPIYQLDNIRVEDNQFSDLGRVDGNNGMAFSVTGPNQNIFVRRNKVVDAKYAAYEFVGSRDIELSDNQATAINNSYTGISVSDNGHRYTTRLTFTRNTIVVKSNAFQIYGGDGGSVTNWTAVNNTFTSTKPSSGDEGSIKLQAASGGAFNNNTVRTGGNNAVFLDNSPQNNFANNTFSNEDSPANNELINFNNSGTYGNVLASSNTYKKQSGSVTTNYAIERNGAHDNLAGSPNVPSVPLRNPDNPANTTNGLDYGYYEGNWNNLPDFSSLSPVKTGVNSVPGLSVSNRDNNYALRFSGYISVPTDGIYTFYTSSDDGTKLLIGSTEVATNDGTHGDQERSGTIGLKAGVHALSVLYFQGGGGQSLSASYSGPGIGKQNLPASALFRVNAGQPTPPTTNLRNPDNPANTVAGLDYDYYEGSWNSLPNFASLSPVKTGVNSVPGLSVSNRDNNYALRFSGYISVPTDGVYTFYTSSDDGTKLLIGSTEVATNDGTHGDQERSGTIGLKAGVHALSVLYFQGGGGQSLSASYSGPGIGKQTLPASALFRVNTGQPTPPPPTTNLRNPDNPANTVAGLDYGYYEGNWNNLPDFSSLSPVKTGVNSVPGLSVSNRDNNYALRFSGYVSVPTDGIYTFYTSSDDGTKLLIGSTEVATNDGTHGDQERSGTIGLKAGVHALSVLYFQGGGGQSLSASYSGPGIGKQNLPASALFRVGSTPALTVGAGGGTGLRAEYFNNQQLTAPIVLTRTDATIDFNWGDGSPAPGTVGIDNFSARWSGQVEAPVSGNYTFSTNGDDGIRLWVNGIQVISDWNSHAATTNTSSPITLNAGQRYDIRMEYFENAGGASAKLEWSYPGQAQQTIPQNRLYPAAASPGRIAAVNSEETTAQMQVYPVPAQDNVWVRYYAQTNDAATVQLVSSSAIPVLKTVYQLIPGENLIKVEVGQFNRGLYVLTLTQGSQRMSKKVLLTN